MLVAVARISIQLPTCRQTLLETFAILSAGVCTRIPHLEQAKIRPSKRGQITCLQQVHDRRQCPLRLPSQVAGGGVKRAWTSTSSPKNVNITMCGNCGDDNIRSYASIYVRRLLSTIGRQFYGLPFFQGWVVVLLIFIVAAVCRQKYPALLKKYVKPCLTFPGSADMREYEPLVV